MKKRLPYRFTALVLMLELAVAGLVPLIHHVCAMDGNHADGICCCDEGHEGMMREEHHAMSATEEEEMPCLSHEGMDLSEHEIKTCCTTLSESIDYRAIRKAINEHHLPQALAPTATLLTSKSQNNEVASFLVDTGPPGLVRPLYLDHASFLI